MIGPITDQIIEQFFNEIKKEETKKKINVFLLDPILEYMKSKLFTYLQFLGALMIIIIVLLIVILVMLVSKCFNGQTTTSIPLKDGIV